MGIETFIIHYGYAIILVGTFFEGETVLVMAGFLSHQGYLSFSFVVLSAFLGTFAGDQLYFFMGRKKGIAYLDSHRSWKAKSTRVLSLMRRNQTAVILLFRFIYGIRTVTPFLIGASGISPWKFMAYNCVGGFAWALVIACLGYVFGHAAGLVLQHIKKYEALLAGFIIMTGMVVWVLHSIIMKRRTGNTSVHPS
ncbi:MAG TPA: DedA family protein [Deltaproteobacteria bacterium]|nr:DedA family protein [Deltaproteobacteria bacterium]HPR53615.1 DedA family protein [Deltaproteobacteria bacterium]HXK47130.1 DedA family protein [Deltaproteobacteria bacterium]